MDISSLFCGEKNQVFLKETWGNFQLFLWRAKLSIFHQWSNRLHPWLWWTIFSNHVKLTTTVLWQERNRKRYLTNQKLQFTFSCYFFVTLQKDSQHFFWPPLCSLAYIHSLCANRNTCWMTLTEKTMLSSGLFTEGWPNGPSLLYRVSHHFSSPQGHVGQQSTSAALSVNHLSLYTSAVTVSACARGPPVCMYGALSALERNCHLCSSTILVCPHQRRATKTALPCICWRISLSAVGETLMSTRWDCAAHPPLWTNKIRVKMKSIITADIFISGLPYLITNFFQGFLEEFILWASLSLFAAEKLLFSYVHSVARGQEAVS